MSAHATEEARNKVNQLQLVFSKAMDVTFESLGPGDIKNCFGELRSEFGNSLDGKLVQQLALSKNRLQGEFEGLCAKYNLVEEIASISAQKQHMASSRPSGSGESSVEATTRALRKVEMEEMMRLVEEMEKENAKLMESRRVMTKKIDDQIAAVQEEESKLRVVVGLL